MRNLNEVNLIGQLGRKPEVNYTPKGKPVANFSVATNEEWTDASGEKAKSTEWHHIVAWERLAEIAGEYLDKGSRVYLKGKLRTRTWKGSKGEENNRTEIVVHELIMLDDAPAKN